MPNYILIGNDDRKKSLNLASLSANMKTGGQGDVYFPSDKICIKVIHNPDEFRNQLDNIAALISDRNRLYEQVRSVSAVPLELVWDESGKKIIGYTMDHLSVWNGLHEIQTEADSNYFGINLRSAGIILAELSRAIRIIHRQGFVIGDLNPSNILFKQEQNRFLVKVIDVDSWSIYRKDDLNIEYASKVLDIGKIYHSDIIQADREGRTWPNFTPSHDWWAFACIGWMVLTKFDPFTIGNTSDEDREDRILAGHTSNCAASVRLRPKYGPAVQALGPKLRFHLDRCLKRKTRRPFPTKLLEEFADGLSSCKKCGFIAHKSAVICPSCADIL